MMKKRVISGIIMSLVLIPILIIGGNVFILAMGMIGILALKELINLKISHEKIPDLINLISFITILLLIFSEYDGYSIMFGLTYKGLAITILSLLIPCLFYKNKYSTHDAFYLIGCVIFLGLIFNSIILIRNISIWRLIYLVLIVTINDIFAYLIGDLIGKHKFSKISPNKTIEGTVAGLIVSTIISTIFYINAIGNTNIIKLIFLTMLISLSGQIGDLVFSKIKRENNIKDYSNLIPGHGGVLDRIDSLIFAVLTYTLIIGIL